MESGNKSKFAGDLSEKFKLITQIIQEESDADVERQSRKENDGEEKKLIQDTGERTMNGKVPKRDKGKLIVHLDGSTSDNRIPKRSSIFEEYIKKKMMKETTVDSSESSVEKQFPNGSMKTERLFLIFLKKSTYPSSPFLIFARKSKPQCRWLKHWA